MSNENDVKKPLTITDVAKLADVSITTVSRVLNDSSNVSKKTRRKVLQVIKAVNYSPNEMARGLATNNSNTIGLLIPQIMNSYYSELIRSIEKSVSARGFSLLLCITNSEKEKEEYYIDDMIRRRVCGIIILSTKIDDEVMIRRMKNSTEIVSVDADIQDVDRINVDSEQGTYQVVKYLLENGHKKIGFVGYQFFLSSLRKRVDGYCKALNDYGVPINQDYIIEGEHVFNPGYSMALQLLKLKDPPTAIHCINEYCASGVYMALMERGLKIPEDISVTAFDGLETSKLLVPGLTTAVMPIASMGAAAADMLIQNIKDRRSGVKKHAAQKMMMFPVKLKIGGSVRKI
ncbi:MAG: LacI family DNA-binding transcriptional regulator [Oscillospiraceae bacterium]